MSGSPSTSANDQLAGRMAGEYRLGRKLGEGGFGAVYEAEHPVLKRRAAVKVLHRLAERDSDGLLRFIAEAQAVNQIRTRHIIDIFSFGKLADGRHFYVMDLLDGEPLDRYLARAGTLDVALTVQILRPIAEALDKAHAAGIVHRDLKPQNIFLSWDASGVTMPILLDFGIAKLLGDSSVRTVSGTPIGTPLYMSPEQARGDKVDGRSDVYSLGVLCHELLTGRPPLQGESTVAILMAHIIETPPRVSQERPDLPPELDGPILQMLEKKPEARPASASEAILLLSRSAERAGICIPEGLPALPRPEPASEVARPGELSRTVLRDDAAEGALDEPHGARASSARRWPARSHFGLWLGVLVALCGLAIYVFVARTASPSAGAVTWPDTKASSPAAKGREPASAPPASAAPQAEPIEPQAAPPAAPTPATHEEATKSAPSPRREPRDKHPRRTRPGDDIPSDLENPF